MIDRIRRQMHLERVATLRKIVALGRNAGANGAIAHAQLIAMGEPIVCVCDDGRVCNYHAESGAQAA